jgi:uncharacterized protein
VACKEMLSKRSLIRIVRTPNGVVVDLTGKLAGRGAYLHDQRKCWEQALKGALASALRKNFTPEERDTLLAFMETLSKKQTNELIEYGDDIEQKAV